MAERVFEPSEDALRALLSNPDSGERTPPDMQPTRLDAPLGAPRVGWADSKEGLARQLEALAQETYPDRHLIVDFLKQAAGLLFQERDPTLYERQHLVSAARGLDSSLPNFWRHSAREAACALRDPTGGAVSAAPASTTGTRNTEPADARSAF